MTEIKTDIRSTDIGIGGMTCASCVGRVERALKKLPGVHAVSVNLATESARIAVADPALTDARLRRVIRDAGYEPKTPKETQADDSTRSPWAGFAPVGWGLLLSAPLVLPEAPNSCHHGVLPCPTPSWRPPWSYRSKN